MSLNISESDNNLNFVEMLEQYDTEDYNSDDDPDYIPPANWQKDEDGHIDQCPCGTMVMAPKRRERDQGKARGRSAARGISKNRKNDTGYDSFVGGLEEKKTTKRSKSKSGRGRSVSKKRINSRHGRSKSRTKPKERLKSKSRSKSKRRSISKNRSATRKNLSKSRTMKSRSRSVSKGHKRK